MFIKYLLGKATLDEVYEEFCKIIYQRIKEELDKNGFN